MSDNPIKDIDNIIKNYHNYTFEQRVKVLFYARELSKIYNGRLSKDLKAPVDLELYGADFIAEVIPADGDVVLKARDYVRIKENREK